MQMLMDAISPERLEEMRKVILREDAPTEKPDLDAQIRAKRDRDAEEAERTAFALKRLTAEAKALQEKARCG